MKKKIPVFIPITGMSRITKFVIEFLYIWSIKECRKSPLGMLRHSYHMSKSDMVIGEIEIPAERLEILKG